MQPGHGQRIAAFRTRPGIRVQSDDGSFARPQPRNSGAQGRQSFQHPVVRRKQRSGRPVLRAQHPILGAQQQRHRHLIEQHAQPNQRGFSLGQALDRGRRRPDDRRTHPAPEKRTNGPAAHQQRQQQVGVEAALPGQHSHGTGREGQQPA